MKTLETTFKRQGYSHELFRRDGNIAIYRRHKDGQQVHFEVIDIRVSKAGERTVEKDGEEVTLKFEESETYPSAESWGEKGWTYMDLADAERKFQELLERPKKDSK